MKNSLDRLQPLPLDQIKLIHAKSVEILEDTGMWFPSERARKIFKQHGFEVEGEIVYFTENDIENALETVPSKFVVLARNPKKNLEIGGEKFAFSNNAGAPFILDFDGTIRKSTSKDYHDFLKINQSLDDIDYNREMVSASGDVHPENTLLYELLWQIKLTDKPVNCVFGDGVGLLSILFGISKEKMKEDAQKGICYAIGNVNPRSPLSLAESQSDRVIDTCSYGVAVCISPMPMAGLTGPCTLPGLLISQNCEVLGTLVLSQLVNPGCPVVYGCIGTITNMKNVIAPTSAPEVGIIEYASSQLANYYGIPTRGDVGVSDANCVDFQAGVESAFHFVNAIRSGIHLMPGLGSLGSRGIGSFEKLVLDAEIAGYVRRLLKPLEFTEETMAVDVIKKVGHKGNFINEQHTFKHYRTEFHEPLVSPREVYKIWEERGKKEVKEKAREKVLEILKNYERPDLDKSIEKDLDKYVEDHYPMRLS